jgi:hypothetical protein
VQFQAASTDDAFDLMWDAFGDGGWWDAHLLDASRWAAARPPSGDRPVPFQYL